MTVGDIRGYTGAMSSPISSAMPSGAGDALGIMSMRKALDAQRSQMAALLATLPPVSSSTSGGDTATISPEALAALAASQQQPA